MSPRSNLSFEAGVWMLFCEQRPRFSLSVRAELIRRQQPRACVRVASTGTVPPKLHTETQEPVLVAVEVGENHAQVLVEQLAGWREMPWVFPVAIFGRGLPKSDCLAFDLMEAGVRAVVSSPGESARLIDLANRHHQRCLAELAWLTPVSQQARWRLPWQSAPWAIG